MPEVLEAGRPLAVSHVQFDTCLSERLHLLQGWLTNNPFEVHRVFFPDLIRYVMTKLWIETIAEAYGGVRWSGFLGPRWVRCPDRADGAGWWVPCHETPRLHDTTSRGPGPGLLVLKGKNRARDAATCGVRWCLFFRDARGLAYLHRLGPCDGLSFCEGRYGEPHQLGLSDGFLSYPHRQHGLFRIASVIRVRCYDLAPTLSRGSVARTGLEPTLGAPP